ncbi:MAG: septum formation protein Maf [Planctomycetes bacterium]|nr:septum formation protein Maf [Planctomycetota bacterium]
MADLVLASTSPYRRELLARLRLAFTCAPPGVDEGAVKRSGREPAAVVAELARQKATAVAARFPDAIVIGGDQCACLDGAVLDKPGTVAAAIAQLQRLSGRSHELHTAVAIVHPAGLVAWTDVTRLTMRPLSDAEIERYVTAERPLDCAGSYKIEALGIALFERIESADQSAIQGLPLLRLAAELRALGLSVP